MTRALLLLILALPSLAPAQALLTATIDEVRVRGNRRSEADAVLSVVASRPGAEFSRARVRADIRAIFQLGFYKDIQVDLSEVDGKQVLTYIVVEKPSIRKIQYEGNDELDDDELKEVVDLKAFGILDLAKVARNAEKLKDLYTEKGYFLAEVSYDLVELPDNEVDVVFRIVEKREVKVARVSIVGNDALSDDSIKERLETREGSALGFMTGAGSFKAEAFERDQLRVAQFYYDEGYIKAKVGKAKVELSPDRTQLFVTIPVEEGERYKTGTVDLSGDFLKPKEELAKLVALETGEWFSSTKLRLSMDAIGELYKDEGYAYVNVRPDTAIDDDRKIVDLDFNIQKGNKVRIGRIRVVGNTRTRDKVIRREMRVYEGEYYSSTGMKRSKRLITRLGFFETVELTTTRGAEPDTMDVLVEVKEKPTGTFQIGAGFSSIESFVAQAQIAQNNLFGRGQSLSLQATLSKLRTIANIRFADDYLLDTRIRFAANVYSNQQNFINFTRESLGGNLTLGYPLTDEWSVSTTYTLEEVSVDVGGFGSAPSALRVANLFANGITSSLRLSLSYDSRNNRLFPSSGLFSLGSVEQADELLGSDNEFTRYRVLNRFYYDLGYDMVLKLNVDWGLITSPSRTGVPIFERFFVGGPLSVRGFQRGQLGPTIPIPTSSVAPDAGTEPFTIGGTEQLLTNLEFEYPIFQRVGIRGVFFVDAGNAFDRTDPIDDKLDALRYSWGFGVRWFSPIGPLRFEWGFPFEPREDELSSVFDFSIGNFF